MACLGPNQESSKKEVSKILKERDELRKKLSELKQEKQKMQEKLKNTEQAVEKLKTKVPVDKRVSELQVILCNIRNLCDIHTII